MIVSLPVLPCFLALSFSVIASGCSEDETSTGPDGGLTTDIALPAPGDFTDRGVVVTAGSDGDWDFILWGGFAGSAVVKDDTFHLYYQGSDAYDEGEGTVAHRAIGLATSSDGLSFEKMGNAPVIEWLPNQAIEEGAASGGVTLDASGNFVAHYGTNTDVGNLLVNADGRVSTSADGVTFVDQGIALDHSDGSVWGSGDELFPVASFHYAGTWYVLYIPNGAPEKGLLGVGWGDSPTNMTATAGVVDQNGKAITAWGMSGVVDLGDGVFAWFVSDNREKELRAWLATITSPGAAPTVTGPVEVYSFPDMSQGTMVLHDDTWYLYHRNADASAYRVKTAPVRQ
jgi:hypothetical protein